MTSIELLLLCFKYSKFNRGSIKKLATSHFYSQAWLTAEILCTWKWQGGSALGSFLPLLSSYAKSGNCSPKEGLLDSIVNILLDDALVYGARGELRFFSMFGPHQVMRWKALRSPF